MKEQQRARNLPRSNFVLVSNEAARDPALSYRARGVLTYCLSHSDEWNFSIAAIAAASPEGKAAVTTALNELKEHGYAFMEKIQDEKGQWFVLWTFSTYPVDAWKQPKTPVYGGKPKSDFRSPETDTILEDYSTEEGGSIEPPAPPEAGKKASPSNKAFFVRRDELLKLWVPAWKERFGFDCVITVRDRVGALELLKQSQLSPVDIIGVAKEAWARQTFNCSKANSLLWLSQHFNEIRVEIANGNQPGNFQGRRQSYVEPDHSKGF